MKYIVIRYHVGDRAALEAPILFPNWMVHALVAEAIKPILQANDASVVSAGECHINVRSCHGKSTSITPNVASRHEEDEKLINAIDYSHGVICL
jgi:hypothetical protein